MSCMEPLDFGPHLSDSLSYALNAAGSRLRVTIETSGAAVLLRAGGEVDACNMAIWRWLLCEAAGVTTAPGPLLVETSGLDFMGCCAYTVLAEQSELSRRRGIRLCLVSNQPIVARVLAAGRLDAQLPCYRNVQAALDACHHIPPARPRPPRPVETVPPR
jgi:anti-anti-sigma factor